MAIRSLSAPSNRTSTRGRLHPSLSSDGDSLDGQPTRYSHLSTGQFRVRQVVTVSYPVEALDYRIGGLNIRSGRGHFDKSATTDLDCSGHTPTTARSRTRASPSRGSR